MAQTDASMRVQKPLPPQRKYLETLRTDLWWVQPSITFVILTIFLFYAPWAILHPENYWVGNYLAPTYSPLLFGDSPHAMFGPKPGWWPSWLFFSPAALILWAPGGFRFTCYYYRGAYYKVFWGDPPACAVGEARKSYWGENWFPLLIQNMHRYFLYLALIFNFFLIHDAWKSFWFADPSTGHEVFGIGLGSIVITLNATFLGLYSFSCHSLRHLIGGYLDKLSKKPLRQKAYGCVTCLNKSHPIYAWISLIWVMVTDIYVRMVASGAVTDWRIF